MSLGQKNPGHVNYRDSKLTRILKPSLSGNARMAVICCISPSDNYMDETRSTLQFATRAKLVKTNAATNEVVENDADVIAKLRVDLEKARLANEGLKTQVRELQQSVAGSADSLDRSDKSAACTVRKELDNLKRFLFDDSQRSNDDRVVSHSNAFTDQDIVSSNISRRIESAVKDDSCRPRSNNGDELLRIALADKAKQVKELQELLAGSKSKKKQEHSRFSLAAYQDIDHYKSQNGELESKLANANSLISSLGKQIDELSTHKNEALDWIEELFAKSEQKDQQIAQANKEKDEALTKCKSLTSELCKTKQMLEFTIGEKEDADARMKAMRSEVDALKYCVNSNNSVAEGATLLKQEIVKLERNIADVKTERDELLAQNDELRNKQCRDSHEVIELEHKSHMLQSNQSTSNLVSVEFEKLYEELQAKAVQLQREIHSHEEAHSVYEEEKRSLMERLAVAENELSNLRNALKAKAEELDDMTFSYESERKSKMKSSCVRSDDLELLEKELSNARSALATKTQALDDIISTHEREKELMMDELQHLRRQTEKWELAADRSSSYEVQAIKEENAALKSEVSCLKRQASFKNQDSDELRLLRMQLKSAKETIAECDDEIRRNNLSLRNVDAETQELRSHLEVAQQRAKDAEKANIALTKRDKDLRESVSKVRQLVDSLASENANLKEKIDGYKRKLSERDTRGRELENLFRSAMNERDNAAKEAKDSKTALRQLKQSSEKMKYQIEELKKAKNTADFERENMSLRLDKMAGV